MLKPSTVNEKSACGAVFPVDAHIVTNFTIVGYSETTKLSIVDKSPLRSKPINERYRLIASVDRLAMLTNGV